MLFGNKPRVYLALYARPKYPNTYHYALHVSPKLEDPNPGTLCAMKYHSKNILQNADGVVSIPWIYAAEPINPNSDARLLVRVLLGKVTDQKRFEALMESVPVIQDDPSFRCVEWVQTAVEKLAGSDVVKCSGKLEWDTVKRTALDFVERKKKEGRFDVGWKGNAGLVATYDLHLGKEIVP
jgi:hypothetical protein